MAGVAVLRGCTPEPQGLAGLLALIPPATDHVEMSDGELPARPDGRPASWPEPHPSTSDVVGRPTDEATKLYRADGFRVEVIDLDNERGVTLDLRSDRIRLWVRDGRVVSAHQG